MSATREHTLVNNFYLPTLRITGPSVAPLILRPFPTIFVIPKLPAALPFDRCGRNYGKNYHQQCFENIVAEDGTVLLENGEGLGSLVGGILQARASVKISIFMSS